MQATVGKFEVRATAVGNSAGKWVGAWSIYLVPYDPGHDRAVAEGQTETYPNALSAQLEALRRGQNDAALINAGTGGVSTFVSID
jgi:hypothetical protein